ncbi:MAG: aldose epimerase family protein [Janthinobacterium lividum]
MTSELSRADTRWGELPDGRTVNRFWLRNAAGAEVAVADLGATLVSWLTDDRQGRRADVLLGFDTPADYLASGTHMGGLIGRWANRIAGASFELDGQHYQLDANDGTNMLHGGRLGFDRAIWELADRQVDSVRLTHRSPAGDNGFPGQVDVEVVYSLSADGTLLLDYSAISNAATPINLTSHGYFNLAGTGTALDHQVQIHADAFLAIDARFIPERRQPVVDTPFDFRTPSSVREQLALSHPQLARAGGFDQCYCVNDSGISLYADTPDTLDAAEPTMHLVANVLEPKSGRRLTVSTSERGLQFYSGNNLEGVIGKDGYRHAKHDAVCFEAQAYPNQINSGAAQQVVLHPGQRYRQRTAYRISLEP